jgi:DNA-binding CsgD family transcriptional regulator
MIITPGIRHRVALMTRNGCTAQQIGDELGINQRTVRRIRSVTGTSRPVRRMTAEDRARAERMLDDGCSRYEVARTIGISPPTIEYHFPGRRWSSVEVGSYAVMCRRNMEVLR